MATPHATLVRDVSDPDLRNRSPCKAKPLFDRYLAANPDEGKDFAEVGSHYLLGGDRAPAALELERDDPWTTERIAGAFLGVQPVK